MLSLNLPAFDAKIAARNGKNVIFDVIRRRYVALTPEEWVRQHFVHFLLAHKGIRRRLWQMRCRYSWTVQRNAVIQCSIDATFTARMIVEYKAPEINHPKVFDQITRYNMVLKVDYLIVSNGLQHYCCRRLRAQQLYFSAGYTRVSKLIGGATNSPLPLSSHRIIYHAWYAGDDVALSSSVSYESMTKAAM